MGQQSPNTPKKQTKAEKTAKMAATRERVAAAREHERKAAKRRSAIIFGASGIAVLALVAGLTVVVMSSDDDKKSGDAVVADVKPKEAKTNIVGVTSWTAAQGHISKPQQITYKQAPPVGGEHDPAWQTCGIYDAPIDNRNGVHSLEHGAVWITYRPGLPADQLDVLKSKVKGKTYMMLTPYDGLESPLTASAWGRQLKLDTVSDPRLDEFIKQYKEGPDTPEPGASCSGGVGKPTQ